MFNSAKRIKILYAVQWLSRRSDYLHLRLTVRGWKINLDRDPESEQSKLITLQCSDYEISASSATLHYPEKTEV